MRETDPDDESVSRVMTDNLWLNLSDGHIASGRKQWGGGGGLNGAMRHYQEMLSQGKNYPLVVKLGTINPEGADVYSYDKSENDMVLDPHLKEHLAHWGIDMDTMTKTDKSMAELELDQNLKLDLSKVTGGDGETLEPRFGRGLVGLKNLGNSCYMNGTLQCVAAVPEIVDSYGKEGAAFAAAQKAAGGLTSAPRDLSTQLCKVINALSVSDRYTGKVPSWRTLKARFVKGEEKERGGGGEGGGGAAAAAAAMEVEGEEKDAPATDDDEEAYIEPQMFKAAAAAGSADFLSGGQQCAMEYLQHLLGKIEESEKKRLVPADKRVSSLFSAVLEERVQCVEDKRVQYTSLELSPSVLTPVPIPTESATNGAEVDAAEAAAAAAEEEAAKSGDDATKKKAEDMRAKVPKRVVSFSDCLGRVFAESVVPDRMSEALGKKTPHTVRTSIKVFPKILCIPMARYQIDYKLLKPVKIDALVEVPRNLDLSPYAAKGPQAGEVLVEAKAKPSFIPNAVESGKIQGMGFSENAAARALKATGNGSADAAVQWLFGHLEDADINDPLPVEDGAAASAAAGGGGGDGAVDQAMVQNLVSNLGVTAEQASAALEIHKGNADAAAMAMLTGEVTPAVAAAHHAQKAAEAAAAAGPAEPKSYSPKYELFAFVTHVGKNTGSGHYVAHVLKDGVAPGGGRGWVLFNDRKVAYCPKPPFDMGYVYYFRSVEE